MMFQLYVLQRWRMNVTCFKKLNEAYEILTLTYEQASLTTPNSTLLTLSTFFHSLEKAQFKSTDQQRCDYGHTVLKKMKCH